MRMKNIGGLSEEAQHEFRVIAVTDDWKNHDLLLKRMITLYKKYDKIDKEGNKSELK